MNVPQTILIEGDEAYMQVISSGPSVQVTRQRERDIAATFPTHSSVTAANPTIYKIPVDSSNGLTRLDGSLPSQYGGLNWNHPLYNPSVGIKENVTFNMSSGTGTVDVLIETRHYVPADQIAA